MNRLIARPVVQLARRPLISSAETGGHAWYRTGFTAFKSHPSIFRYLGMIYFSEFKKLKKIIKGLGIMATSFIPSYVLFMDYLYDDRKRKSIVRDYPGRY